MMTDISSTQTLIERARAQYEQEGVLLPLNSSQVLKNMIENSGIDAADAIAEIREFNGLIEDHVVEASSLKADPATGKIKIDLGTEKKEYEPRMSFLSSVSGRINSRTSINRTSGIFLQTLRSHSPRGLEIWADLMNLFFELIHKTQTSSKRASNNIKVRCLKKHAEGKWGLSEAVTRAIVSEDYRDDNSHLWLITALQKLAPGGKILSFSFNGDTMHGFWIIPELIRKDGEDEFGVGLAFKQGEIANASCMVEPAVFSASAGFWSSWGRVVGERYTLRHNSAFEPDKSFSDLNKSVDRQVPLLTTAVNRLVGTKKFPIDRAFGRQYVTYLARQNHVAPKDAQAWLDAFINETKEARVYDIINAFLLMTSELGDELKVKYADVPQFLATENWNEVKKVAHNMSDDVCEKFLTS